MIEWSKVLSRVGNEGVWRVKCLREWLEGEEPAPSDHSLMERQIVRRGEQRADRPEAHVRIAPSIITRSEAELFGLSSPRFALRLYLNDPRDDPSFFNLRSLVQLQTGIDPSLVKDENLRQELEDLASDGVCIADSFLRLPKRLENRGFVALYVPLAEAYGENPLAGNGGVRKAGGTPFIQHLQFAAGMCIQSTWFMATVLMEKFCDGIFPIPEITALVEDKNSSKIYLDALTVKDSSAFFQNPRIGLRGRLQAVQSQYTGTVSDSLGANIHVDPKQVAPEQHAARSRMAYAALCLRSYVASGMPVILPVDIDAMWTEGGLAKSNRLTTFLAPRGVDADWAGPNATSKSGHAVVLVGYNKNDKTRFIFNDPASYPFLVSTIEELDAVRHEADRKVKQFSFIPITPKSVTMPLYGDLRTERGLLFDAWGHQTSAHNSSYLFSRRGANGESAFYEMSTYDPGEWRIVKPESDNVLGILEKFLQFRSERDDVQLLVNQNTHVERWYWFQFISKVTECGRHSQTIWIWDAEDDPTSRTSGRLPVVVLARSHAAKWSVILPSRHAPVERETSAESGGSLTRTWSKKFRPALLSSFSASGYQDALRTYEDKKYAELYAFMDEEIEHLFPSMGLKRAIDALSGLAAGSARCRHVAERLSHDFHAVNTEIIGLASFLPEISSANPGVQQLAVKALQGLVGLAIELQGLGHPTKVVELVAGSRLREVHRDNRGAYAIFRSHEDVDEVVIALSEVVQAALEQKPDSEFYLSIELEPGLFFSCRDAETMKYFAERVHALDEPIARHIGLNLDVSHWLLARVDLKLVAACPVIRQRLVHTHFSGHYEKSHLGDIDPHYNLSKSASAFDESLNFVAEIANDVHGLRGSKCPQFFSNFITLELEAALDNEVVDRSWTTFKKLLE